MNRRIVGFIIMGIGALLVLVFIYFLIRPALPGTNQGGGILSLPFGDKRPTTPDTTDGTTSSTTPDQTGTTTEIPKEQKLFRISSVPISGYTVFEGMRDVLTTVITKIPIPDPVTGQTTTEEVAKDVVTQVRTPRLRYNDQITGELYETELADAVQEHALVDSLIPTIGEIVFDIKNGFVARYYDASIAATSIYRGHLISPADTVRCELPLTDRLTKGMTGRNVEQAQSALTDAGISVVWQPGVFDDVMEQAIIGFQKQNKMKADGIIGRGTNQVLRDICQKRAQEEFQRTQLTSSESPYRLVGDGVVDNVAALALSPDQTRVFSMQTLRNGNVVGIVSATDGSNAQQVYQLPFSDWLVTWPAHTIIALTTKASVNVPGSLYTLNVGGQSGILTKIWGNQLGLTTLVSPNASKALYSRSTTGSVPEFGVFDMVTHRFRPLSQSTLPEKCVWRSDNVHVYCMVPKIFPEGSYPDDWYQYAVTFDDALWDINVITGETTLIDELSDIADGADAVQLQLSKDESYLFFKNQKNGYLWGYHVVGS